MENDSIGGGFGNFGALAQQQKLQEQLRVKDQPKQQDQNVEGKQSEQANPVNPSARDDKTDPTLRAEQVINTVAKSAETRSTTPDHRGNVIDIIV